MQFENSTNYYIAGSKIASNGVNLGTTNTDVRYQLEVTTNTKISTCTAKRSDNKEGTINFEGTAKTNLELYLFCKNTDSNLSEFISARIYEYKIEEDGNLVKEFIPCYCLKEVVDVNGKNCPIGTIGILDLVKNEFYTNQGTGQFTKGVDINE